MKHTFQCHSSTLNFMYPCGVSGCTQTFKTFSAITSHFQRKHPHCDFSQLGVYNNNDAVIGMSGMSEVDIDNDSADEMDPDIPDISVENSHFLAQRSTALLLLNLKERHRLTQAAVDFSVGQIKEMVQHVLEDVRGQVKETLATVDIDDLDLDKCFDIDPFQDLNTEYSQVKFYREHFNLVVSQQPPVFVVIQVPQTKLINTQGCVMLI